MMIGTPHVVAIARLVRITSMTFALAILVGFVAIQAFAAQYGSPGGTLVRDADRPATELTSAISRQESTGLTCSRNPALTDIVLFQRLGTPTVDVLNFDQAIAASSAREGWIRRYCV